MFSSSSIDVLVAGGGIVGLCSAIVLAQPGVSVRLFEKAKEFAEAGAGIQISPNAMQVLTRLGLEQAIRQASSTPEFTRFKDWKSVKVLMETPLRNSVYNYFGQAYLQIHRAALLNILVEAAQSATAELPMGQDQKQ